MKRSILRFMMVFGAVGLLVAACGGGGSGSSVLGGGGVAGVVSGIAAAVGVFQGSTVVGVHYRAILGGQVKEGETDAEGKFQYLTDGATISPVTFSVGGVTLGTVTPPTSGSTYTMNVVDLVDANDPDAPTKALNIQRFLNSINTSGNTAVIQITAAERTALASQSVTLNTLSVADFDASATTLVNTLVTAGARPVGTTLVAASTVQDHMNETKSQIDAMRVNSFEVVTGAESVVADGQAKVLIRVTATTLANTPLVGGLVHFEATAGTLGSETGLCAVGATVTSSVDKVTDASGMAYVMLTPQCTTANAVVSVSLGGKIVLKTVQFIPGPANQAQSEMVVNPSTLPADGVSTASVTVILKDSNGNLVADDTRVTLMTDAGTLRGSPATTVSGRATFTFVASATNGTANLSVSEYNNFTTLQKAVTMGVVSSTGGKPNSLQMVAGSNKIFVRGVGKSETTGITIQVHDDAGDPISESGLSYLNTFNNLRVTLKTHPQGGESIAGLDASGTTATGSQSILVRTTNGSATVALTAGTRPGVVEVKVEALDTDGSTVLASAVSSVIAIASGPAHNITLSEAYKDGIVNLKDYGRGGVYCRLGSALVTDRYGNAVPDGTTISLNLLDTVLASTATGSLAASSAVLTDAAATFSTASIGFSGVNRMIQAGDQVLIEKNVPAQDRRRFVASAPTLATTLTTNANYSALANPVTYYVGASLRGGAIHGYAASDGCDPAQLITGVTSTVGGVAPIRVTYPANEDTLQLGCLGYTADVYSTADNTRFPNRSGQVLIVASVNDLNDADASGSTVVTKGKFCFSAVGPATITSFPTTLGIGAGQSFNVYLVDDGLIPIPNVTVTCSAAVTSNASGSLTLSITSANPTTSNASGVAGFTIDILRPGVAGATPDTGTITCQGFGVTTTIAVTVP